MRRSEDFRRTVRHGVRAGRRTVVVHALRADTDPAAETSPSESSPGESSPPLIGFVVSKSVGSAVRRNRVRRRLRHLVRGQLPTTTDRTLVVIRALPPSAAADAELGSDLESAWSAAMAKLDRR